MTVVEVKEEARDETSVVRIYNNFNHYILLLFIINQLIILKKGAF